jgi:alpha-glucosidase
MTSLARIHLLASLLAASGMAQQPAVPPTPFTLHAPSAKAATLTVDLTTPGGLLTCAVSYRDQVVIRPSRLGLVLEGAPRLDSQFRIVRQTRSTFDHSWKPAYGERAEFPDRYHGLEIELQEEIAPRRRLIVEFRVYDEGVAFRYRLPAQQPTLASSVIGEEATEFRLEEGVFGWFAPRAQTLYQRLPITAIPQAAERPFLMELPNGLWAAIAEAGVEDYSSMFLTQARGEKHSLAARLQGPVQVRSTPFATPWRVILMGQTPGELLEHNYLLQNLSPPSRLKSTTWIRPGKVLREVTLSTRGGREAVDFAVENGLQYIEYDAGWYGHEYDEESDATTVSVDPRRLRPEAEYQGLDLQEVIRYARSHNVGVLLYINRRAMERQLDQLLPLFSRWGVAGLKYGFVNVHTQPWTRWLYDAVRKAADHQMILDIHDEFRPTGMSRTYPNLLTQEGILGNEGFPDAAHSTILPFTRMLAGSGDYTYCWLDPRLKNTWTHQMALSVILYSPLQFVYWYDRPVAFPAERSAGMEWFRTLPTVWDDTRVMRESRPGEFAAMARRNGANWHLGAVTNDRPRQVRIPLDMLDANRAYTATLYTDGPGGVRDIQSEQRTVRRGDVLQFSLASRGGAAAMIVPVSATAGN